VLYRTPPSKQAFCDRIEAQLKKGQAHIGIPEEMNLAETEMAPTFDEDEEVFD
jgi:hypothetical protein